MVSVATFSTIPGTKTGTFQVQIGIKFRHVLKKRLVPRFFLPVLSVTTTLIQTTKVH